MERDIFQRIRGELRKLNAYRRRGKSRYSDGQIVHVYFWSVINDRPVSWACLLSNWPGELRPRRLPSQSRMSRRLRSASVKRLMDGLENQVLRSGQPTSVVTVLDGKALPLAAHSHDRHARWGRGAGGKQKGYKLHMLMGLEGTILTWRVAALNIDEREMARRMLRDVRHAGYTLADTNFDSNALHDLALSHGGQLVAPRRYGADKGLGHHRHSPGRLRCRDLLENSVSGFGRSLYQLRRVIERQFGYLTSTGGLLTHLPAWVRTHPRVRLWVQSKLILSRLRTGLRMPTLRHHA